LGDQSARSNGGEQYTPRSTGGNHLTPRSASYTAGHTPRSDGGDQSSRSISNGGGQSRSTTNESFTPRTPGINGDPFWNKSEGGSRLAPVGGHSPLSMGHGLGSLMYMAEAANDLADDDRKLLSTISAKKLLIKSWLPKAFKGFETELIDVFIVGLRDKGGFVTVQDLLDAHDAGELTREVLCEISDFKVGHCNRLYKLLRTFTDIRRGDML
jgi:hypothetical protein